VSFVLFRNSHTVLTASEAVGRYRFKMEIIVKAVIVTAPGGIPMALAI
jgi:hypothetical protein